MREQEIFDRVTKHLLTQNKKSIKRKDGGCFYRGQDNTMCAIGCLITDKDYTPDMEHNSIENLLKIYCNNNLNLSMNVLKNCSGPLLKSLQQIHDRVGVDRWYDGLLETAERYGLTFNP